MAEEGGSPRPGHSLAHKLLLNFTCVVPLWCKINHSFLVTFTLSSCWLPLTTAALRSYLDGPTQPLLLLSCAGSQGSGPLNPRPCCSCCHGCGRDFGHAGVGCYGKHGGQSLCLHNGIGVSIVGKNDTGSRCVCVWV